jgi:hypothetical protein
MEQVCGRSVSTHLVENLKERINLGNLSADRNTTLKPILHKWSIRKWTTFICVSTRSSVWALVNTESNIRVSHNAESCLSPKRVADSGKELWYIHLILNTKTKDSATHTKQKNQPSRRNISLSFGCERLTNILTAANRRRVHTDVIVLERAAARRTGSAQREAAVAPLSMLAVFLHILYRKDKVPHGQATGLLPHTSYCILTAGPVTVRAKAEDVLCLGITS